MQNTYSGVNALVCAAVLLGLALCLQGCEEKKGSTPGKAGEGFCSTAVVETYGVVTGTIRGGQYGPAVVDCNTGLIYQGPALVCMDLNKVCPVDMSTLECRVTPGFAKAGTLVKVSTTQAASQKALDAEALLQAETTAVALAKDREVACTNYPASDFKDFVELTPEEQAAVKALGHSAETWDAPKPNPPTDNQKWEELTDEHKEAATALGWTQPVWDAELAARTAYLAKAAAAETAANPTESEAEVKKEVAEDVDVKVKKFTIQRINVGGGVFTPMGVSFVLCMCLVLAVSIRAVQRHRHQYRSVDLIEADPELLESKSENIPQ